MITNKVLKYIEEHKLCSDYLFDDWSEFLKLLYEQGGCVESILWFEHVLITEQEKSLGGGGYIDKNNAEYMYAETYICNNDLKNKTLETCVDETDLSSLSISTPKFLVLIISELVQNTQNITMDVLSKNKVCCLPK